jgi:hypothetical protein
LNVRYGQRARDLLLDSKDQWITQGVYSVQTVKKTEVRVTHNFLHVSKALIVPVGHDLVIENNYSQGNAKVVNRSDTFNKQLNILFAAEITAHESALSVNGSARKVPKSTPTVVTSSAASKRRKINAKTEPEFQSAYKPPPPRAVQR